MPSVQIRDATSTDAEAIASLLVEQGYPSAPRNVRRRLGILQKAGDRVIAAAQQGDVVGFVTIHLTPFLHRVADGRLTTVVVAQRLRGLGVGRRLVEAAERVVRKWGCGRVEVTSGVHRTEAHGFYQHLGYAYSANRFTKALK